MLSFFRGPKFDLVASAKLRLENISNNITTHDLTLENIGKERNVLLK